MKYAWVSLAVAAIWISLIIIIMSGKLDKPDNFYLFIMITTVVLAYIGFRTRP